MEEIESSKESRIFKKGTLGYLYLTTSLHELLEYDAVSGVGVVEAGLMAPYDLRLLDQIH
jgi:hypothetical protein